MSRRIGKHPALAMPYGRSPMMEQLDGIKLYNEFVALLLKAIAAEFALHRELIEDAVRL